MYKIGVCIHLTSGEALAHIWDDGVVTTAATCVEKGVITYTCTLCEETKAEPPAKTAHKDLNNDGRCDVCSKTLSGDVCKYCGKTHTGAFGGLVRFFHSIAYFFRNMFGGN